VILWGIQKNHHKIAQEEVLRKWGLEPFPVGGIYSPLPESAFNKEVGERLNQVRVSVPGRLNCLIKDPVALVRREPTGEFNYGEISFGIDLITYAEARTTEGDSIVIAEKTSRPSLVRHFAEIVRRSIDYDGGIYIEANNDFPYSHIGTGSSAALATATALAINKLAGEPLKIDALPLFLARNYGEEIVDDPVPIPADLIDVIKDHRYSDRVFVFDLLEREIFQGHKNKRPDMFNSYEECLRIRDRIMDVYHQSGYSITLVPFDSVENRELFVIRKIGENLAKES